jgi:UMF1 family MFS transporter
MSAATSSQPRRSLLGTREQVGWYFYDWANSAFSTTVVSVFLGPYLTSVTRAAADSEGFVHPLGIAIRADAFFPYMVSLSVLLQVFFLPIMGAIVDYTHLKKRLMAVFAYTGAFATIGLYFLNGDNYLLGGGLFLIANLSFGAAMVCYNAFLPEIAGPNERDKVSSVGWAMGYLGGGLLLAVNLVFFSMRDQLGIDSSTAVRISLASAGMWWALFTLFPLARLQSRQPRRRLPADEHYLTVGFKQLGHTLRGLPRYSQTLLFLIAYLLYNDGIQTIIALSAQFGSEELGMGADELPPLFLMVQFVAFFGALFFGYMARWIGAKRAILVSLVIWSGVAIYAYSPLLETGRQFFLLARCDRAGAGRQPGVESLALFADDPQRSGDGVFQPLRDQRTRDKLAGAALLRAGDPVHGKLPDCRAGGGCLLYRRVDLAAAGGCAPRHHGGGE